MTIQVSKEAYGPQEWSPLSQIAYNIFRGKTDKSLWPVFSFVFYRIFFLYLRFSVGIVYGVGKLCNSVYLIFIYKILTYFIFWVFFQRLWKTGHPYPDIPYTNVINLKLVTFSYMSSMTDVKWHILLYRYWCLLKIITPLIQPWP